MRVNESIWVRTHEDKEHPVTSGAYIEVFERSGSVGARMSFFDSDHLRGAGELKAFHRALGAAIDLIEADVEAQKGT
jgi:hypothetical protein